MTMTPFHYAFYVTSLSETEEFYKNILDCEKGRSAETWIDFNFFGHQISCHLSSDRYKQIGVGYVDGIEVPMPHFGALLSKEQFEKIENRLINRNTKFIIEPNTRFKGLPGQQRVMFFKDPSGNPIELKYFSNLTGVYK